jgi:hypothetical protein
MVDGGRWTVDGGWWTVDGGRWTVDGGRWMVDGGWWTVDGGRWTVDGGWWMVDGGRLGSERRIEFDLGKIWCGHGDGLKGEISGFCGMLPKCRRLF